MKVPAFVYLTLLLAMPPAANAVAVAPGAGLSDVIGVGNVATSPTTDVVYGPALATLTRDGVNVFGDTFSNTASSRLESGNPVVEAFGTAGAAAQAALVFAFRIDGPDSGSVPILLTGTVSVSTTAGPTSYAEAFISRADGFLPIDPMIFACVGSPADPACAATGTQTKTETLSYSVMANVEQSVYLHARIDAESARTGSLRAFADPIIVIDPAFAEAGLYTISFSPGVSAPVPEPATGLLAVLGLGVMAWRGAKPRS